MRARIDRTGGIVREAVAAVGQQTPAVAQQTALSYGGQGGAAMVGGRSIQDEDGNLYFMVDISTVDGPDVVGP